MHPILFKIGPFTVYSYGMMVAVGFILAVSLIARRAPKFGLDKNKITDLMVLMLITGIIGARLLYVLLNLPYYISSPVEIINISKGGLVWYGGFFTAFAVLLLYIRRFKMDFWSVTDLIMPYVALGQALGRIGCFLNGCCYGKDGHPVQIYSAVALFLIFMILRIWQDKKEFNGEISLGYCALYAYKRFLMEFLRADNPRILFSLTMSQLISIAVLTASIIFFIYKAHKWKKRSSSLK